MANARTYQSIVTPIADVLAFFGKSVERRGYMYFSPFHDEAQPSMHVKLNADGTWVWTDFSMTNANGKPFGGGCVDLIRELAKADNRFAGRSVSSILTEINGGIPVERVTRRQSVNKRSVPTEAEGPKVVSVCGAIVGKVLFNYITGKRCIPAGIANRYCNEVVFSPAGQPDKKYNVIGFRNNAGGWVVRGPYKNRKINVGRGDITYIDKDGKQLSGEAGSVRSSESLYLFEGFIDFLSFLAWTDRVTPGVDVIVLNSTSLAGRTADYVKEHTDVRCFFDNDKAGNVATDLVRGFCKEAGVSFLDGRTAYPNHDDVNEAWQSVCAEKRSETVSQKLRKRN